jgi:ketosteroid isomerase-like protein
MRKVWLLHCVILCIFLVTLFSTGCQKQQGEKRTNISPEERNKIVSEVTAAMNSYEDAVRRLDAERTIAHFAKEPEFRVCFDNQISDYDTLVSQVRRDFASVGTIEGGFTDITVLLLGPGVAAAIAPFRETYVDKSGNRSPVKGTVTWIWGRRGTEWKILYGHAAHEPDTGS